MIIYLQYANGDRDWYKVNDVHDLQPIFAKFPMTKEISISTITLRDAVDSIVEYLDGHGMSAWVEDKELSKSLRNKAAAIGFALATTASTPANIDTPRSSFKPSLHPTQVAEQKPKDEFGTHPMDRFLWNIKQIESSGGKNLEHKPIKAGRFKGKRAIGRWGLLKPTVQELVNRMRSSGSLTPEYQKLETMSRDQLDEHFRQNPQIELNLARRLAEHVHKRQGGNSQRAAYAWLHGHNLFPSDISKDKVMSSDYVDKYRVFDNSNPYAKDAKDSRQAKLNKVEYKIDSEDFKMRVKAWLKRRDDQLTEDPMRTSNFQPDMGRIRDEELDQIKPDSMKTSSEKLADNVKRVNEER